MTSDQGINSLFIENKICRLKTPIIIGLKKDKVVKHFFTIAEYKAWENSKQFDKNIKLKYSKGLGSWRKEELKQLKNV